MRRATVVAIAVPAALAVCGASSTAAMAPASTVRPAVSAPCTVAAQSELMAVIRRIYDQALSGRVEASAVRRIRGSSTLASAVASGSPRAVRAALVPLIKHQITRIDISAGTRTLARIGSAPSYAPVRGPITLHRRVVGRYVLTVSNDAALVSLAHSLTGATVRFVPGATTSAASFPTTTFPSGHARIALSFPRLSASICGATTADTRLNVIGLVARNVMNGEAHSRAVTKTLRHVALNPAFRRAVAAGDPAAVRAAIIGFFRDSRFHIVRVRAWKGARLINDVGGPYVLSPASDLIRGPGGVVAGRFMLAVQEETGYIKLVHLFTGADVVLHTNAGTVPGSNLTPGPPFTAGLSTITYHGRAYRDYGLSGTAFPSGPLRVSLLIR